MDFKKVKFILVVTFLCCTVENRSQDIFSEKDVQDGKKEERCHISGENNDQDYEAPDYQRPDTCRTVNKHNIDNEYERRSTRLSRKQAYHDMVNQVYGRGDMSSRNNKHYIQNREHERRDDPTKIIEQHNENENYGRRDKSVGSNKHNIENQEHDTRMPRREKYHDIIDQKYERRDGSEKIFQQDNENPEYENDNFKRDNDYDSGNREYEANDISNEQYSQDFKKQQIKRRDGHISKKDSYRDIVKQVHERRHRSYKNNKQNTKNQEYGMSRRDNDHDIENQKYGKSDMSRREDEHDLEYKKYGRDDSSRKENYRDIVNKVYERRDMSKKRIEKDIENQDYDSSDESSIEFDFDIENTKSIQRQNNNGKSIFRWMDVINATRRFDFWFDRVVGIRHFLKEEKDQIPDAPGVLINRNHVLTSYNPFRRLIRLKVPKENVRIYIPYKRIPGPQPYNPKMSMDEMFRRYRYREIEGRWRFVIIEMIYLYVGDIHGREISCGRPVVPLLKNMNVTWHGRKSLKENSPTHDLMVMRLKDSVTFEKKNFSPKWDDNVVLDRYMTMGPRRTVLAKEGEDFGKNVYFGSFATLSLKWVRDNSNFLGIKGKTKERVVPCDKWIPREWGHFICILVKPLDAPAAVPLFGSGGPLYSRKKLFGIGSFSFQRGNVSILVFTDVRPYYDLIFRTCLD